MENVKLTPEVKDFLQNQGTVVTDPDGKRFLGLTGWFEEVDEKERLFKFHEEHSLPSIILEYMAGDNVKRVLTLPVESIPDGYTIQDLTDIWKRGESIPVKGTALPRILLFDQKDRFLRSEGTTCHPVRS
jgi:hypothetical protein